LAALLVTGGVVLQLGGCGAGGGLGAVLLQNFAGLIFSALLSALLGDAPAA
jgi:hypothetical protein